MWHRELRSLSQYNLLLPVRLRQQLLREPGRHLLALRQQPQPVHQRHLGPARVPELFASVLRSFLSRRLVPQRGQPHLPQLLSGHSLLHSVSLRRPVHSVRSWLLC